MTRKSELLNSKTGELSLFLLREIQMLHDHFHIRIKWLSLLNFIVESKELVIYHVCNDKALLLSKQETKVVCWFRSRAQILRLEADQGGHLRDVDHALLPLVVVCGEIDGFVQVLVELVLRELNSLLKH
jgi:hypothetical protein